MQKKVFLFFMGCLLQVQTTWAQNPKKDYFTPLSILQIKLKFETTNWDWVMDSLKKSESRDRIKAATNLNGVDVGNAKVQYKGNSSYFNTRNAGLTKLPFNIKLKETTFKLANGFRDPSMVRDALSYDIVRTYMPSPKCNFAELTVNDKKLGLYTNVEAIDESFINRIAEREAAGWVIKCDPEWQSKPLQGCPAGEKSALIWQGEDSTCYKNFYDMDKEGSWATFIEFIKILNQQPEKLESVLNIDQTLWMLALDNIMVNLDSYIGRLSHNFYLWRAPDNRFHPIIWDLNLSFGGFFMDGASPAPLTLAQMQTLSPLLHFENPKRPLISQLLKNPIYRKIYVAHYRTILKDWFLSGKYLERAKEIHKAIAEAVEKDKNKLYGFDEFKKNIQSSVMLGNVQIVGIEELMSKRIEFLKKHPLFQKTPPTVSSPTPPSVSDGKMTIKINAKNAKRIWLVIRNERWQPFRYLPMSDDGLHNDDGANDDIWGVVIDPRAAFQYYFLAENDDAIQLLPEKASHEFLIFGK